jgi:parallel beta-helix repeat protein
MKFDNCRFSGGSGTGIYLSGTSENVIFSNIVTSCSICNKEIATKFLQWKDKDFDKVFQASKYRNQDKGKIHILGICEKCFKKVAG